MMRRPWINSIIIVTFVGTIATAIGGTLFQTFAPFIEISGLDEYREPAPPPDIIGKIAHGDGRIAHDVNAWFDDRMGFRSVLTRVANQIDYSIFSYSEKVLIGKDGWLFDPSVLTTARDPSSAIDELSRKMAQLAEFLRRRNIRLVVITTPAKETFYPEYLPTRRPSSPAITTFEKFSVYLKSGEGKDWIYIDSRNIFTRAKSDGVDLYFHTDHHSTTYGSLLIAKTFVNRLAEAEGVDWRWDPPNLELFPQDMENGSNLRFLSLFSYNKETILEPRGDYAYPDNPPPDGIFEKSPPQPFEVIFHNQSGHSTLPRTVLFGSSFLDRYLSVGAYSHFRDVYRVRGKSDEIGPALQAIPEGTRYFVYQVWETHLMTLRDAEIPE